MKDDSPVIYGSFVERLAYLLDVKNQNYFCILTLETLREWLISFGVPSAKHMEALDKLLSLTAEQYRWLHIGGDDIPAPLP